MRRALLLAVCLSGPVCAQVDLISTFEVPDLCASLDDIINPIPINPQPICQAAESTQPTGIVVCQALTTAVSFQNQIQAAANALAAECEAVLSELQLEILTGSRSVSHLGNDALDQQRVNWLNDAQWDELVEAAGRNERPDVALLQPGFERYEGFAFPAVEDAYARESDQQYYAWLRGVNQTALQYSEGVYATGEARIEALEQLLDAIDSSPDVKHSADLRNRIHIEQARQKAELLRALSVLKQNKTIELQQRNRAERNKYEFLSNQEADN